MGFTARDIIDQNNVIRTYTEGKYICFVLKNGITVKLNPNEAKGSSNIQIKEGQK